MNLYIDDRGFLWADDFRLPCRVDLTAGFLEFIDKDHIRSEQRGSRYVNVPIEIFNLSEIPPQPKTELLKE
jgi:hypothetical protein